MFDYLQKFNSLPADLRAKISSPSVMAAISELENKYRIDLAMTIMKVMIKSLSLQDLPAYFISDFSLTPALGESLSQELKARIFMTVGDYLNLRPDSTALDLDKNIDVLIKEAGIRLPSSVLVSRFKNTIGIYLKGIRNKIDTRNTLAKDIKIGGLKLSESEIERVLKICDSRKFMAAPRSSATTNNQALTPEPMLAPKPETTIKPVPEYDLKRALAAGQVKNLKISAPNIPLDLPEIETILDLPAAQLPVKASTETPIKAPLEETIKAPLKATPPSPTKAPTTESEMTLASSLAPLRPALVRAVLKKPASVLRKQAAAARPPRSGGFWANLFKKKAMPVSDGMSVNRLTAKKAIPVIATAVSLASKISPVAPPAPKTTPVAPKTAPFVPKASPVAPKTIPIISVPPTPKAAPVAPKAIPPIKPVSPRPAPTSSISRPMMHDIKPVPKVMGPLEELQFLDLVNFRRLGKTPAETTDKILAKIKLLERDGYDKMVAGVLAWRQSPVNRLYLRLVRDALNQNLLLKDYLLARQAAGQEYLSLEEIEALVGLNTKLIF